MWIVTDLTRFAPGNPNVCTALVEMGSGVCVRPMPYFKFEAMKRLGVVPGAMFSGKFTAKAGLSYPHFEDCDYADLKYHGPASKAQFRDVLVASLFPGISNGFGYTFSANEKVVPHAHASQRSIITIRVPPDSVEILPDTFNEKKIKICFIDEAGMRFRFMPITDLGFFDHASSHQNAGTLAALNRHIGSSEEVFLRVGLSRRHSQGERDGFWLQVNGIYTFPSRLDVVRGYGK